MKKIFLSILFLFIAFSTSFAIVEDDMGIVIEIDTKDVKQTSIVIEKIGFVNGFDEKKSVVKNANKNIKRVIDLVEKNLGTLGLFQTSRSEDGIFQMEDFDLGKSDTDIIDLVMAKYKDTGTDGVLSGYLAINSENEVEIVIRFFDILDQRELFKEKYVLNDSNWKRTGDKISDFVYKHILNESDGNFDSRIMFVVESGTQLDRKKRIAMVDYDGSNFQYITNGENMVLTPVFSRHNHDEVIFLEYRDRVPYILKFDMLSKNFLIIGNKFDLSFAPNFNPVGENELLFSAAKEGISNIYRLNFATKFLEQITHDRDITTVPSYSPDGKKIVYVSDKTGIRKLYVMDREGKNSEMISKNRGSYDKPAWSPSGTLIAFIKLQSGRFLVGLMNTDGENERIITEAYLIDGLRWSPNGRYLIYSKQVGPTGKASIPGIYTMDILTGNEYKVPTPANLGASDPDWIKKP